MEKWQLVVIICAGSTAIIMFFRLLYLKILKPLWKWGKKWETIYNEFVPDHGKSIKDQINSIEKIIVYLKSVQDSQIILDDLPIITCNGEGRCIKVNKSWQNLAGLTETKAIGWGWLNAIYSTDRKRVHDEYIEALAANTEINLKYKMYNEITNNIFNAEAVCVINRNSRQEVISIVGTVIKLPDDVPVKEIKNDNGK